jgi:WD40 repeat protein
MLESRAPSRNCLINIFSFDLLIIDAIDLHHGQILAALQAHETSVTSMVFDAFFHQVLTGSATGELKVWDATSLQLKDQLIIAEVPPKLFDARGKRAVSV